MNDDDIKAGQVQALLGRSLAVIQDYIDEIGGCDHSVGICCCELIHLADDIRAALAEALAEQPKVKPTRTVTYVCPVCAASLGRQE